jgi:hypothetical protein
MFVIRGGNPLLGTFGSAEPRMQRASHGRGLLRKSLNSGKCSQVRDIVHPQCALAAMGAEIQLDTAGRSVATSARASEQPGSVL